MIANLIVLIVVAGCAAYLYLKTNLVKSVSLLISAVLALIVSFSYFELISNIALKKLQDGDSLAFVIPWLHTIILIFVFTVVFTIFQIIAFKLLSQPVDMGLVPERAGRIVCGLFLGLIVSGVIITALALGPLQNMPYARYDSRANLDDSKGVLLAADSFAVALVKAASAGGLSGNRSFATVHADYLQQIHLNKLAKSVDPLTVSGAIRVPRKNAAWIAPEDMKVTSDSNDGILEQRSGFDLVLVRVGINSSAMLTQFSFSPSQVRLICKPKQEIDKPLAGRAINIYPEGFVKDDKTFYLTRLNQKIDVDRTALKDNACWYDFGFYIPLDYLPVLVEFKQNALTQIQPKISESEIEISDSNSQEP